MRDTCEKITYSTGSDAWKMAAYLFLKTGIQHSAYKCPYNKKTWHLTTKYDHEKPNPYKRYINRWFQKTIFSGVGWKREK